MLAAANAGVHDSTSREAASEFSPEFTLIADRWLLIAFEPRTTTKMPRTFRATSSDLVVRFLLAARQFLGASHPDPREL
jgi:hypothetical protein